MEAEADTLFQLNFWGSDDVGIDTTIYIYHQDGTNIVPVQTFDADSRGRGEAVKYMVSQAGTYYFGFLGADLEEIGLCRCDITAFPRIPATSPEPWILLWIRCRCQRQEISGAGTRTL